MKTIIDDKIPFIRGQIEALIPDSRYIPGNKIGPDDVKDADVLIVRTRTRCDQHLLQGSKVRLIVTATIGYDHIDTRWCETHAVEWHNCPGCNANSVATYIGNVLSLLTTRDDVDADCPCGTFSPSLRLAQGKLRSETTSAGTLTIGIIGCGHVGRIVATNCRKAGFNVICHDPLLGMDGWQQICQQADVITFHVPLTYDGPCPTYHMADHNFFNHLRKRPTIINTSRGGVVDEQALINALDSGTVSNAVIDTWEGEPNINLTLLARAMIATPHIAGYSLNGKLNATRMTLQAVGHWLGVTTGGCLLPTVNQQLETLTPQTLLSDSQLLKASSQNFEAFRSNYPWRMEPNQETDGKKYFTLQ